MAWKTFYVVQKNGNDVADGQMNFEYTITPDGILLSGAVLQYSPSAAPLPPPATQTTILTTSTDISLDDNEVYPLPDTTLANKFNIPPKGAFKGGDYNQMTGATYDPDTNKIQGIFQVRTPGGEDAECSWTADAGL